MSKESYLRWLARAIPKIPQSLKIIVTAILRTLMEPYGETVVGWYGMIFGVMGILVNSTSFRFLELSRIHWGFVALTGFFLLTHGFYRNALEVED